ncbi:MAG TPA: thioesterase family protein [Bacillales bacterium]|nr:thioesterase family protein [Bacillales bacterium]
MGHVNNSSYFIYLEQGRVEFFDQLEPSPEGNRWHFILASVKCDFLQQAFFNQKLSVETKVARIGNKSFQLAQPIYDRETRDKIAYSESAIIYFNFETQQSEPIPQSLRTKLENYLVTDDVEMEK